MPPAPADPPPAGVLTLEGPQDLLAALPYRLGFHPRRSLVLLELSPPDGDRGRRHALGVCVRADLPTGPDQVEDVARSAVLPWRQRTASGPAVLVVYADADPPGLPDEVAAVLRTVEGLLAVLGTGVHDVLAVGPRRWRSLRCASPGCCPPQGRPVAELAWGAVAAEAVLRGLVAAPSREALAPELAPLPATRLRAARRALVQAQRTAWTPG
ncbi:DUF4192 family protein, partial [Kineococcus rubinsiae]|uniref:DUF4192 family protein n=1 Tax=Kineococcus rubinsiae TaxID=2609562 RepID=UPI00142F9471